MNRKDVREFLKKRSTIWTLSLCMTGAIVLGGITSMDQARRKTELTETESEPGAQAQLDVNDTLGSSLDGEEAESDPVAAVAGNEVTEEKLTEAESEKTEEASAEVQPEAVNDAGQSGDIAQPDGTGKRSRCAGGIRIRHFQRSAGTERDCIWQPTRSSCSGRLPGLY